TRDVGVVENAIALPGTAERSHGPVEHVAAVVERDDRAGLLETRGPVGGAALLLLRRHRVDHRVALLPLRRGLALARRRLHEPGLDAELAEAQALVDLDAHLWAREQRVIVLARVLEQVAGELLLQRALVPLEPLVILRPQPDRVLVGDVHPRDRGRAVRVHLLRELARDLDRLDLRREGTGEHPLDEALDPGFEVPQDADLGSPRRRGPGRLRGRKATCLSPPILRETARVTAISGPGG